jgi:hypothetical protein
MPPARSITLPRSICATRRVSGLSCKREAFGAHLRLVERSAYVVDRKRDMIVSGGYDVRPVAQAPDDCIVRFGMHGMIRMVFTALHRTVTG